MATDARSLAAAWDAASDDDVRIIFTSRGVAENPTWTTFFDAADALLEPSSVATALGSLSAHTAHALQSGTALSAEDRAQLNSLGLAIDGVVLASVQAVIDTMLAVEDVAHMGTPVDSAAAAERALVTVSAVADLLLATYAQPISRIGTGAIGSSERRRLVDAGIVAATDDVDSVIALASDAGLLRETDKEWLVTAEAAHWLHLPSIDRWRALRDAYWGTVPTAVTDNGWLLPAGAWPSARPWSPSWPSHSATVLRTAELLGLIDTDSGMPTLWSTASDEANAELLAHLPHEVDRVFLQNDLSVIAPGPLAPALDLRLRTMTSREPQAQASTYRFTSETMQNALSRGETEESISEFLSQLSLTGIPQPLQYLVHESATRHGAIAVSHDPHQLRTYLSLRSEALRQTLIVDQSLRPLGLVADGAGLSTRVSVDTVALALADAHYPVAVVGHDGEFTPLQPGRTAPELPEPRPSHEALLARLRSADLADLEAAWLQRELEQAVRNKAVLSVTVRLNEAEERTFVVEAAGLGGGRLRGRDRAADVERTLPLSHIVGISTVTND